MSDRASSFPGLVAGAAVRAVIPTDFDQATRFAKTAVEAGLFRAESEEKALAQATMAVLQGLELGLPPMQAVQQIAIIGGRCTVWGDLVPAMIWRAGHKIREWIEGDGDARVAWCEITRGDNREVIKRKFSVDDAKRAGLWDRRATIKRKDATNAWHDEDNDNPWYRYEERMLQMRARGFCARDGVPDVLHGLYIREEIEEERRFSEPEEIAPVLTADELSPPPAPEPASEDKHHAWDAPKSRGALVPPSHAEIIKDPDDFLSDLDVSLAACKSEDQLDEVWAENLETVCGLGMLPRQKAELIYERHHSRLGKQAGLPVHGLKAPVTAAPGLKQPMLTQSLEGKPSTLSARKGASGDGP